MRPANPSVLILALLAGLPALAQTYSTTPGELRFQGAGTAYYYPGYSVTPGPLVFHGAGTHFYYPGSSVTTEGLVFKGIRAAVPTLTPEEAVTQPTGLGARTIKSGLSGGSPLGQYKGPKTDKDLNPTRHISPRDAADALLGEQPPPANPVATFNAAGNSDDAPAQEQALPHVILDAAPVEAPPPPEPDMPQ
jgi:hypothetical protein